jgi:hypothetical protein
VDIFRIGPEQEVAREACSIPGAFCRPAAAQQSLNSTGIEASGGRRKGGSKDSVPPAPAYHRRVCQWLYQEEREPMSVRDIFIIPDFLAFLAQL